MRWFGTICGSGLLDGKDIDYSGLLPCASLQPTRYPRIGTYLKYIPRSWTGYVTWISQSTPSYPYTVAIQMSSFS